MKDSFGTSQDSGIAGSTCAADSAAVSDAPDAHSSGPRAASPDQAGHVTGRDARAGVLYGVAAFSWWGLITIYFKAVAQVPAVEVLAHRVFFSAVFLWALLLIRSRGRAVWYLLQNRRNLLILCGSTLLIACNWGVFIWAVGHSRVTQASLGYFINPLLNVLMGYAFLGERLQRLQKMSVLLALTGVTILTVHLGEVPTIALVLPATFGLYGLVRKVAHIDAMLGLTAETTLLAPVALGYLVVLSLGGQGHLGTVSLRLDLLLVSAGVITALPLIWFLHAARLLRLSTLGFLQYIAPTVQLALGVLVYGEPFTVVHLLSFGFVWAGLALYAVEQVRDKR